MTAFKTETGMRESDVELQQVGRQQVVEKELLPGREKYREEEKINEMPYRVH